MQTSRFELKIQALKCNNLHIWARMDWTPLHYNITFKDFIFYFICICTSIPLHHNFKCSNLISCELDMNFWSEESLEAICKRPLELEAILHPITHDLCPSVAHVFIRIVVCDIHPHSVNTTCDFLSIRSFWIHLYFHPFDVCHCSSTISCFFCPS